MSYDVKPIHPIFGAEVTGIDCSQTPTPEVVEFVEDAMAEYAVLVLRDQTMTDEEHAEWSRYFGPRESPAGPITGHASKQQRLGRYLFDAGNLDLNGKIMAADHPRRVMRSGDRLWHTDSSFNPLPTKWSMLHGRTVPPEGGNTDFADCRAAYDALPEETKARMENLMVVHNIWHSRIKGGLKETEITEEQRQSMPPVCHPLVRIMPRSNRKAMMIGAHAEHIVGMPDSEAQPFLQELADFATQPQFVYSHKWHEGDLVIWDNRCTLHRATSFDDLTYPRDMRRTTIDEYAPSWSFVD